MAFRTVLCALLASQLTWAAEPTEPCAASLPKVFEAKVSFAGALTGAQFGAELTKLKPLVQAIVAADPGERAALVRLESGQRAAASVRVPTLVKLTSPFNTAHRDFTETMASRLGVASAELEFFDVEPNSPAVVLRGLLTPAEAAVVANMKEVRWVGVLEPLLKVSAAFAGRECPVTQLGDLAQVAKVLAKASAEPSSFSVGVFEVSPKLRALLDGYAVTGSDRMFFITAPPDFMRRLATQPEVEWVEPPSTATVD